MMNKIKFTKENIFIDDKEIDENNIRSIYHCLSYHDKDIPLSMLKENLRLLLRLNNHYTYTVKDNEELFEYNKIITPKQKRLKDRLKNLPESSWIKNLLEENKDDYEKRNKKIDAYIKTYDKYGGIPINFNKLFKGIDTNLPIYVSNWYEEREHWVPLLDIQFYDKSSKHSDLKQCVNLLLMSEGNLNTVHEEYSQLTVNDFLTYIKKIKFHVHDITYNEPSATNSLDYRCILRGFRFFPDAVLIVVES
jgi:hypothetical protein